jgi:multidrug efflux system membrane fusion protein
MRDSTETRTLEFASDPGAGRSKYVAASLLALVVLWMGSGVFLPSPPDDPAEAPRDTASGVAVQVLPSEAQPVTRHFLAKGQAQPHRDSQVRAEASGNVVELLLDNGAPVHKGDTIARIDDTQYRKALAAAQEEFDRAKRELDNARTLRERGTATNDRVIQAEVDLATAENALTQAREALADTTVTAPFDGRLEELPIEVGEFISTGEPAARVVDISPLTVTIQVPQQLRNRLSVGAEAQVAFLTGEAATGTIQFIAAAADPQTRTFLAEIEVPNEDGAIPAGISAEVSIATGEVTAHFISPAILSLDTQGRLGVKTVTEDDHVAFHEITIASAGTDGIWVTGLPDRARIITVGQGFVTEGDLVAPRETVQ